MFLDLDSMEGVLFLFIKTVQIIKIVPAGFAMKSVVLNQRSQHRQLHVRVARAVVNRVIPVKTRTFGV